MSDGFKVSAGTYAGFVIKAFTDADDDAGLYRATVSVKKDGKTVKTAYVFARVWVLLSPTIPRAKPRSA